MLLPIFLSLLRHSFLNISLKLFVCASLKITLLLIEYSCWQDSISNIGLGLKALMLAITHSIGYNITAATVPSL